MQADNVQEGFVSVIVMLGIDMGNRTEGIRPKDTEFIENIIEFAEERTRRFDLTGNERQTIRVKPFHARIGGGGQDAIRLVADADGRDLPASTDEVAEEPAYIVHLFP